MNRLRDGGWIPLYAMGSFFFGRWTGRRWERKHPMEAGK